MSDGQHQSPVVTKKSASGRAVFRALTESLRHEAGVREGDGVLVACSGGADSVALVRALHTLSGKRRWRVRVEIGHVQHQLRDSAERDAAFVRQLATTHGLPHHRRDLDLKQPDLQPSENLEARARRARYEALREVAQQQGLRFIATAHHADDQLETLLMRLMRGSAIRGMVGIAPARTLEDGSSLIRPLLGVTRNTLRTYLQYLDQAWCEDETNADTTRTRAALRHGVLPTLLAMRPDLPERLEDWTRHARQLEMLLEQGAADVRFPIQRHEARRLNPAVLQAALRNALGQYGESPDRLSASRLRSMCRAIMGPDGHPRRFEWAQCTVLVDSTEVHIESN